MANDLSPKNSIDLLAHLVAEIPSADIRKQALDLIQSLSKQVGMFLEYRPPIKIPDFVLWESDMEANFTYISESSLEIFGYTSEEWLNTPNLWIDKIIHPEDQKWVRHFCAQETKKRKTHECTYRAFRKDGKRIWIRDKAYIQYDSHKNPTKLYGFMMNVTEKKIIEETLTQIESRYRMATRITRDIIWDWDLQTNEIKWNESMLTILSYPAERMKSDVYFWYDNIHPDDRERVVNSIHNVIDSGQTDWSSEYRYRTGIDTYIYVVDRGVVIHDEKNKPVRVIGAMTDISSQKKLEHARIQLLRDERTSRLRAEAALRERSELFDIMSHDLKNPLSSILMNISLAKKATAPFINAGNSRFTQAIDRIYGAAERMKTLIDDLLIVLRSESNRINLELEGINLEDIISQSIESLQPSLQEKNLKISINRLSNEYLLVEVDHEWFFQGITKLLKSIIRFSAKNTEIKIQIMKFGTEALVTASWDTLPGYGNGDPLNFFERKGSDLDLAITKGIITLHHGKIWVDKPRENHLVISLTLPIYIPKVAAA